MSRQLLALLAVGLLAGCAIDGGGYDGRSSPRYGVYDSSPGWYGSRYERRPRYGHYDNADRYYRDQARRNGRLVRKDDDVVCDRRTQVCYKDGDIDKSETRDQFGKNAAKRADRVRDRYDDDAFLPRRNVVCDRDQRVCYKGGDADRKLTRDFFGKKAARRVND